MKYSQNELTKGILLDYIMIITKILILNAKIKYRLCNLIANFF